MRRDDLAFDGLLSWYDRGYAVLGADLLRLMRGIDGWLERRALERSAEPLATPAMIPAAQLDRVDYFGSFPHLATFAVALDPAEENLARFAREHRRDPEDDEVRLTETAPVRDVLTPAVCYHFYSRLARRSLDRSVTLSAAGTCFRREREYRPLVRQWSFTMREIACVGTAEEVDAFLTDQRHVAEELLHRAGLSAVWRPATDPFFQPHRSAKHLVQKLEPLKLELVLESGLALASVNHHRGFFGDAFGIERSGRPASSGCAAFGLERWLFAVVSRFGPDPSRWPSALVER